MTRGRHSNLLHIVAADMADARQQYIDTMTRDRADRGLAAATRDAREAVTGLVDDGIARLVNAEKARLRELVIRARQQADRCQQWADEYHRQTDQHHNEWDAAKQVVENAKTALARAHEQAAELLAAEATADAARLAASQEVAAQAREHVANADRFTRRAAQADAARAEQTTASVEADLAARWGSAPSPWADTDAWAGRAATHRTETTPEVAAAELVWLEAMPPVEAAAHIKARQRAAEQAETRRQNLPEPPRTCRPSSEPKLSL